MQVNPRAIHLAVPIVCCRSSNERCERAGAFLRTLKLRNFMLNPKDEVAPTKQRITGNPMVMMAACPSELEHPFANSAACDGNGRPRCVWDLFDASGTCLMTPRASLAANGGHPQSLTVLSNFETKQVRHRKFLLACTEFRAILSPARRRTSGARMGASPRAARTQPVVASTWRL